MERDTTRSLSRVLEEIRDCKEADRFIDEHAAQDSFTAYINEKMADKGRTPAEVRDASGISKNYFYNILNGDRKNPSRDRIIAIAVGLGLDYGETQRALELAGKAPLYPRNVRDVKIAVLINKGCCSVTKMNMMLEEQGIKPLEV